MSNSRGKHNGPPPLPIVRGENPSDFTDLLENLAAEYQPETEMQRFLVNEATRAVWELSRINREFDKSQKKLYSGNENMHEWDSARNAEFERMSRYRSQAERKFHRASQAVEHLRKLRLQAQHRSFFENFQYEKLALARARLEWSITRFRETQQIREARQIKARQINEDQAPRKQAAQKQESSRKEEKPPPSFDLYQLVNVRVIDGITSPQIYPSNEEVLLQATVCSPGTAVLRCFEFPNGIPAEYAWINGPDIAHGGIVWEQTFDNVQAWRAHTDWEASVAPGRLLPVRTTE